jgi:hypothetical protein
MKDIRKHGDKNKHIYDPLYRRGSRNICHFGKDSVL